MKKQTKKLPKNSPRKNVVASLSNEPQTSWITTWTSDWKVWNKSCEHLSCIPDHFVDCVITSPPYKEADGYNPEVLKVVLGHLFRMLKPGATLWLNFGQLAGCKDRASRVALMAVERGFTWHDTFVLVKRQWSPVNRQVKTRVDNRWEYMFQLVKGDKPWNMNRKAVGVPYEDKSNVTRYGKGHDLRCRGNVWWMVYQTIQSAEDKTHKDRFPYHIPHDFLLLSNLPEGRQSVVLDPFMGGGTTGWAALDLGYRFLGFEINPDTYKQAVARLKERKWDRILPK